MKTKVMIEKTAWFIFFMSAVVAIFAVCSITIYMILKGTPALKEVGVFELLFQSVWKPTANHPSYGILYIILSSIVGTAMAVLVGVPVPRFSSEAFFTYKSNNMKLLCLKNSVNWLQFGSKSSQF